MNTHYSSQLFLNRRLTAGGLRRLAAASLAVTLCFSAARLALAETLSDSALQQIAALQAEKDSRTPAQIKMDSQLVYLLKQSRNEPIAAGVTNLIIGAVNNPTNGVLLDIKAQVNGDLLDAITNAGGLVIFSSTRFSSMRAYIPLAQLESIAGRSDLVFMRPAVQALTCTGSVDSEGDITHKADIARATFGVTGAGVKVGVLSDSVDFLSQAQSTGDLPPNVTVLPGQSGFGAGEGTAMLEIIYDLAPGAQLFFASGFNGEAQFAQNILDLRAAGCDIIVDDIFYFDEPPFQNGIVAQAVNSVTADGALYFSAAGNEGNVTHGTSGTWEGDFADGGPAGPPVNGRSGVLHSFGANTYDTATRAGFANTLFWSDPQGQSTNDYDLYVLDASGANVVSSSTTVQNGTQDPFEIVPAANNGQRIVIVKANGDPRFLHLETIRGRLAVNTTGKITGHCATTNAFACAAIDVHTAYPGPFTGGAANPVESFSSDGPRRIFYDATGVAVTPGNFLSTGGYVLQKPDIAAADGVATTLPANSGLNPFFGTSAAAPHAGAIAALLKSYNPTLTLDDFRSLFAASALDNEAPGIDINSGVGIIMADRLLQIAPLGVNLVVVTNYLTGGNGNGSIDPNECDNLAIVLQNLGTAGATNIVATITTTNAGVIIAQKTSVYPNTISGGLITNVVPFKISTTPNFVCGSTVYLNFVVKSDAGSRTNILRFDTGTNTVAVRFDSSFPVPIPDNNPAGASSSITVSNITGPVGKVSLSLYITHTFDSDLLLELIAPDGTTNILSANNGFAGNNYGGGCFPDSFRTAFDDSASNSITSGNPPFVGSFKPEQPLAIFNGKSGTNVNGAWQLHVVDQAAIDVGTIQCWSLFLSQVTCTDGGGQCPGVDLSIGMVSAPEPTFQGTNFVYTISMTNAGPDTAKNAVMSQILPVGVVFVSAAVSQGGISQGGGVVTANLGTLPAGAVATATVVVTPLTTGVVSSTASITSNNNEFDPSNNSYTLLSHINPPFSDLVAGLVAIPNPVLVGQQLTYVAAVTNNGPAAATTVTLSNVLPASVGIISAVPSQGSVSISNNVVVATFGGLANGGHASVSIQTVPVIEGSVTATATAFAAQADPVPGNNIAIVNTVVGASADLSLGIAANPISIVPGTNVIYTIRVTNSGPSTATGVIVNDSLPANVSVISTNASKGSISVSNSLVTVLLGSMTNGEVATVTIGVGTTGIAFGTLVDSVTVSAVEADPNTANNTVSVNVLVSAPTVRFAIVGAQINSESQFPTNGTVDPGETVNVSFFIQNIGNIPNGGSGLVVSLLATNGVTSPSGAQNYGTILQTGVKSRDFTFTASGTNGGTVVATFLLQYQGTNQTLTFTFFLPSTQTFANTNRIDIPSTAQNQQLPGPASPYPSAITVSGVTGLVNKVTVTLSNLNHTFPHDINLLLVGPTGLKTVLLSDAAADSPVTGADVTFDDSADSPLPAVGEITSGSWQLSAYDSAPAFSAPAPAGTNATTLSVYNSPNPNGVWALYANDDSSGDFGSISGGWSISFSTLIPVNQVADLALSGSSSSSTVLAGSIVTNTFVVTNAGPNNVANVSFTSILPPGVTFISASNSLGATLVPAGDTITCSLGSLAPGGQVQRVWIAFNPNPVPALTSTITNVASVAILSGEADFTVPNNTVAQVVTVLRPYADLGIAGSAAPATVTVGSNILVNVTVTNAGPNDALQVVVSNPVPANASIVAPGASQGSASVVGANLIANLGTIPASNSATVTFTVVPGVPGPVSNFVRVLTASLDMNSANDSITLSNNAIKPSPVILAGSATLLAESLTPHNATIDAGETVTLSLSLTNAGVAGATNLTASLLATGGVNSPSGSQNYGTILPGAAAARSFTFTAGTSNPIVATLLVLDAGGYSNLVTFIFTPPTTTSFTNSLAITIPDHGTATPYPSSISVSGLAGAVDKITVSLFGLTHGFPDDLDIMLVSPTGKKLMLMSDCGGGYSVSNLNLTFSDSALSSLPDAAPISAGTYKPTDFEPGDSMPSTPAGPLLTSLSALSGTSPNGTWSLYVVDDSTGDAGVIAAGWSISITTVSPLNPTINLILAMSATPSTVLVNKTVTYTLSLTNQGPTIATNVTITDVLPIGLVLVSSNSTTGAFSVSGRTVTLTNVSLAPSAGLVATLNVSPTVAGTVVNSAVAAAAQTDLDPLSDTTQSTITVVVPGSARLSILPAPNHQLQITLSGDPGQGYQLQASSNLVNWVPVINGTTAPNGTVKFGASSSAPKVQFYRSVRLP